MGLEPGNCLPDGRDVERERGHLVFLEGQSAMDTDLELGVLDGPAELEQFRTSMQRLG